MLFSCEEREFDNPYDPDVDISSLAPYNLEISTPIFYEPHLSWKCNAEKNDGYIIEKKKGEDSWAQAAHPEANVLDWTDTDIEINKEYTYRIKTVFGTRSTAEVSASFQSFFPAPTDFELEKIGDKSYRLQWAYNSVGEQGFKIDRRIDSIWQNSIAIVPANQTSYTDTNIFRSLNIEYRVYAYYENAVSEKISAEASTDLLPPVNLLISRTNLTSVLLSWEGESEGEQGFIIERKYDGGDWVDIQRLTQTSFEDQSFALNTTMNYQVMAFYGAYKTEACSVAFNSVFPSPENVQASISAQNETELSWSYPLEGADGFKIDRKCNDANWIEDYATIDDPEQKSYIDSDVDIEENTYAYRVYAYLGNSLSAKAEMNLAQPTVNTLEPTEIQGNSAVCLGNVSQEGASPVTARGICWGKSTLPNITGEHSTEGSGTGTFSSTLNDLEVSTHYFVRAYATNSFGTAYGDQKEFETTAGDLPSLSTAPITNIGTNVARGGGQVTSQGGTPVTAKGICWSISSLPALADTHSDVGAGIGSFTSTMNELTAATIYYVRAYATNEAGTAYGGQQTFTTSIGSLPAVSTSLITDIEATTATGGGTVTGQGGTNVTMRGVCWSTGQNPDLNDEHTTDGSGIGSFDSALTGLVPGTKYYMRAYATNTAGTAYGGQQYFTTKIGDPPTVSTLPVSNIEINSATSGGLINSQGGTAVTMRGVCWSIYSNPDLNDAHTENGSGTGGFVSELSALEANTQYFVRAYATNSAGTNYGGTQVFTTLDDGACPLTMTDDEGNVYNTVLIGDQCWMKENLNIGTRISGLDEMTDNSTIEKYCYDNNEANCDTYGGLYQWNEMMQYATNEGSRGICPEGWHLPTDDEWKTMEMTLGMSQSEADSDGWRGSDQGEQMKSTNGWTNNGNGTNSSGFTALPGGRRSTNGSFYYLAIYGYWGSSSESLGTCAWLRHLSYDGGQVSRDNYVKTRGRSVRCLKD